MTVIILNVHHRGATQRMPGWLRRAAFVYLARLLCVKTPYAHHTDDAQHQPPATSTMAAVNVEVSPPPSPIEPIWKRRADTKPTSPASAELRDRSRSCAHRDRLELTLRRMFRRSERTSSALPTCNGCAFVADAGTLPQRRRRSRANGASRSSGNSRATVSRDPPASEGTDAGRDEVLSPLLKTAAARPTTATRRHSAATRRLNLAGHCRSEAAWSTQDSGVSSAPCRCRFDDDDNVDADTAEQYANEWRELARILDRLCFWILLVLMTISGFVILLYPKYTGSESDWGTGIT